MKTLKTRILSLCLAAGLTISCAAPAAAAGDYGNFVRINEYSDGQFSDVGPSDWFRDSVAAVYELGLMQGAGDGSFNTTGSVRVAEAVALASRLHSLYRTGAASFATAAEGEEWYRPYADYALKNGLLDEEPADYNAAATRREFAVVLARSMPASALPAINDVADDELPDVKPGDAGAPEIYRLYRAGVLTGNNLRGTFTPEQPIARSAAAVILSRMAYRSLRQKFVLEPLGYPDLDPQTVPADDTYFADAAMLGNSLVDGMQLFSGLGMDFYGSTGANVFNNTLNTMLQKQYAKVYIEFGINEISYATQTVMTEYGKIIDRIREAMPEAVIYVMAVTPVTKARSSEGTFTMKRINDFNMTLRDLAAEKRCWYLDCCSTLVDGEGYLVGSYAGWDGSPHLSADGYKAWADVMRTYYV